MRSFLLLAALALAVTAVAGQAPIPYRPDGYNIGAAPGAPIVMDAFVDLLCPDCAAAWPTLKGLVQHYGSNLQLQMHLFPLPYHTNGFIAAQAAHVCLSNGATFTEVADFLFDQQANFWNGATANITVNAMQAQLGDMMVKEKLLTASQFNAGMADPYKNNDVRVSWKYACSRGVLGTPTFLINGVQVNGDPSWSVSDWQQILDPLLQPQPSQRAQVAEIPAPPRARKHHRRATETIAAQQFAGKCSPRSESSRIFVERVGDCPAGQPQCNFLPGKFECCFAGEMCIPNVGCRC